MAKILKQDKVNEEVVPEESKKKNHHFRDKIKKMRKFGLDRGGESDSFNIIYKVLSVLFPQKGLNR